MDDPVAAARPNSALGQSDADPSATHARPGKIARHLTKALLFGAASLFSASAVIGQAGLLPPRLEPHQVRLVICTSEVPSMSTTRS